MDSEVFDQIRVLIEVLARDFETEKKEGILELAKEALNSGVDDPARLLWTQAISPAMTRVGEWFHGGDIFIPELLFVIRAVYQIEELIRKRYPQAKPIYTEYPIVIGTVQYDICHMGKNVVRDMLIVDGFPVFDLGIDVAAKTFVESVKSQDAKVVALSCFLTTSLPCINEVIELLEKNDLRHRVKVIAGGAAVTEKTALERGADGYGKDAWEAVEEIKELLGIN